MAARFFETLFTLDIEHDYYNSDKSGDLLIEAMPDTEKLMRGHKQVLRKRLISGDPADLCTGINVLYESYESAPSVFTPTIEITSAVKYRFALRLNNMAFANFTDLPDKTSRQIFYYSDPTSGTNNNDLVRLQNKFSMYTFTAATADVKLEVYDENGVQIPALDQDLAQVGGGEYDAELDLVNYPDAKYTVKLFDKNNALALLQEEDIYADDILAGASGIFGIVEINRSNNTLGTFALDYTSKQNDWKYFVVVKDGVAATYEIQHTSLSFSEVVVIPPGSDDEETINGLLANYPSGVVKLFKSDAQILYSEDAKQDIQLIKNSSTSPPLVSHLSNPRIGDVKPEVYVYV